MKSLPIRLGLALVTTCAFLPAAHAGSILVSRVVFGDLDPDNNASTAVHYDLDTYGSIDWVLYTSATGISKSGGTAISGLTTNFTTTTYDNSGFDNAYSWTGGTPTASATKRNDVTFARSPASSTATGDSASLTASATTSLQTLYIFAGAGQSVATLDVSLGDASASAASDVYDVGNDYGHIVYKIDYFADTDTLLNVSWTKTSVNNSGNSSQIRFQGAALTNVPEPSAALLSSITALGLLTHRRKR